MFPDDEKTKFQINIYKFIKEERKLKLALQDSKFESQWTSTAMMFLHMEPS